MPRLDRANRPNVMPLLLLLSLAVVKPVSADDLTGMPHDDPKDFVPPSLQVASSTESSGEFAFQPMPSWARGVVMPSLPQTLKPMGRKVVVLTTPPVAAPTLAPPKDSASNALVAKPKVVNPAQGQTSAMIAVSPFLQWIKSNPQAAAEQAHQQANAYQPGPDANLPAVGSGPGAAASANVPGPAAGPAPAETPYWMPPLVDSPVFGTSTTGGSSAAIYSTPQR